MQNAIDSCNEQTTDRESNELYILGFNALFAAQRYIRQRMALQINDCGFLEAKRTPSDDSRQVVRVQSLRL